MNNEMDTNETATPVFEGSLVSLDMIIEKLNEIFHTDPDAMRELLANRAPCNEAMANHNSVQIAGPEDKPTIGMVGLLNGFIEPLLGGRIAATIDESGKMQGFVKYLLPAKLKLTINENDPIEI